MRISLSFLFFFFFRRFSLLMLDIVERPETRNRACLSHISERRTGSCCKGEKRKEEGKERKTGLKKHQKRYILSG